MTSSQVTLWFIVFAFIGANMYAFDRKRGVKIYAKWRKWTSPKLEPANAIERGFIYNRSNKVRWSWASTIAGINFFVMVGWRHEDPRTQLVHLLLITPSTWFGFLIGPLYMKLIQKREWFFKKLDAVESGETTVGQEVHKVADGKFAAFRNFLARFRRKKPEAAAPSAPPKPPVDPAVAEAEARAAIAAFGKRRP